MRTHSSYFHGRTLGFSRYFAEDVFAVHDSAEVHVRSARLAANRSRRKR